MNAVIVEDFEDGIIINKNYEMWHSAQDIKDFNEWIYNSKELKFGGEKKLNIYQALCAFDVKRTSMHKKYISDIQNILF